MKALDDPGFDVRYRSGKKCVECLTEDAGTAWGPYFCPICDRVRLERISEGLNLIAEKLKKSL